MKNNNTAVIANFEKAVQMVRSSAKYAMAILQEAPTVDVVEIVRCEKCKNAEPYDCTIDGTIHRLYECKKDKAAIGYNKVVAKNDFCSCGKRKEDDTDETCIYQL